MEVFEVVAAPSTELSYTNKAIINPGDSFSQFEHIAIRYPKKEDAFVFSVTTSNALGRGKIGFNLSSRKWASLTTGTLVEAAPYEFEAHTQCLNTITFSADFASRQNVQNASIEYDTTEMSKQFMHQFYNQAFTVGQIFGFAFQQGNRKVVFELTVKELEAMSISKQQVDVGIANVEIGLTTPNTIVMFERAENSDIKLIGGATGKLLAPKIFSQDWDFAKMGIGGLSEQFNKIFRRAFASRLLPPAFAQAIGTQHVRGILLFGPPGTGKTLIARQIGQMLLAREPKIVNGPEVLNKYVGESEANIRKLFQEAEEEQAKLGINSGLHMIIFDEIDAICKSRGNSASSAGVGDNVVNQLLSKIDGVNSLHNVLLIGMTNRRDLIDEALLRPGRLEVQIEIGLPNKHGRLEIFNIHTKKLREKGILDESVSLEVLAETTRNYTGAEIAGLISAAQSIAINRVVKPKEQIDQDTLAKIRIKFEDFVFAMEHDVKPALGASEDQLRLLAKKMIPWDPNMEETQKNLNGVIKQICNMDMEEERPFFVLLYGEPATGLTTIAANTASQTQFPFIRIYQASATADMTESSKVQYMKKLFDDAGRSELSCVVMDDLDIILDYCHIGPRFSNTSRAVFTTKKKTKLPKGHRMLVICTCSNEQFLKDLSLDDVFDEMVKVPSLTRPEHVNNVITYLTETGDSTFTQEQRNELVAILRELPFKMGIEKLQRLIQAAASDEPDQRVKSFISRMHRLKLVVKNDYVADFAHVSRFT